MVVGVEVAQKSILKILIVGWEYTLYSPCVSGHLGAIFYNQSSVRKPENLRKPHGPCEQQLGVLKL